MKNNAPEAAPGRAHRGAEQQQGAGRVGSNFSAQPRRRDAPAVGRAAHSASCGRGGAGHRPRGEHG